LRFLFEKSNLSCHSIFYQLQPGAEVGVRQLSKFELCELLDANGFTFEFATRKPKDLPLPYEVWVIVNFLLSATATASAAAIVPTPQHIDVCCSSKRTVV
jgi:hypothetical protein